MKNGIPSEKYYFLLEWKDANMEEFISIKGEVSLCDLSTYELNKLYEAIKAEEKILAKTKEPTRVRYCKCLPMESDFIFEGLPCDWCTTCGGKAHT